jgi:hypothetical protein
MALSLASSAWATWGRCMLGDSATPDGGRFFLPVGNMPSLGHDLIGELPFTFTLPV